MAGTKFNTSLPFYKRGEKDWPPVWRLPEGDDDADLFDKMAHLADDVLLREAVHIYDNCLRAPGSLEGVLGGLLSAHARLVAGCGGPPDIDKAVKAVGEAWRGMLEQALAVQAKGDWE